MNEFVKRLIGFAEENWSSWWTGAFVLVSAIFLTHSGLKELSPALEGTKKLIIVGVVATACVIAWRYNSRCKRHQKGKIGIDLLIFCEDRSHDQVVLADFGGALQNLVNGSRYGERFSLICHSRSFARSIKSLKDAEELNARTRALFTVFGKAKTREINNSETYILELGWVLRHEPISEEASREISEQFRRVFPSNIEFQKNNSIYIFKFTAEWVDVVAKYCIAIAMLIRGDVMRADELLVEVNDRFRSGAFGKMPGLKKLKGMTIERLSFARKVRVRILYNEYFSSREKEKLVELEEAVEKASEFDPQWESVGLIRGLCEFVLRRNVQKARSHIISASKNPSNTTWRFSMAFLDAYEGNLKGAEGHYRVAFSKKDYEPNVLTQVEEFITLVLEEEPEKTQLCFCLGMINFRGKSDLKSARTDLERFIECADHVTFRREIGIARKWCIEIERELKGISGLVVEV